MNQVNINKSLTSMWWVMFGLVLLTFHNLLKKKNSFKMKGKAMIKKKKSRQYTPPHFYVSTFNYYSGTDGPL